MMGTLANGTTEGAPFHGMKTPVALNPVLHGATFQTGSKQFSIDESRMYGLFLKV